MSAQHAMLSQYRVLDLSDEHGLFCGYILGHLGAEVIAVEPPGGSSARRLPPFDASGESLWWQAYARGKSSREIDLESDPGKQAFLDLLEGADFLIESFSNTDRERLAMTYEHLAELNPAIICVSITPFGTAGPKADWPASDLTVWAASGAHALAGDSDRAPVRTSVPQSFLHAGADAASAALIALQARHKSGLGQHVDVSAQQSSAQAALSANLVAPNNSEATVLREAGGLAGVLPFQLTWPCRDGFVAITLLFGHAFVEPNRRLFHWVHEAGFCSREEVERDWELPVLMEQPLPYLELCRKIEAFTLTRTRDELFEEGLSRGIYIAPTLTIEGLFGEKQFHERAFWHTIDLGGKKVRVPGEFARFSRTPLSLPGPAGVSAPRSKPAIPDDNDAHDTSLPLSGLKVLDFMWVIAGPFFTRVLADYGATVIKVESTTRLEPARGHPPFKDDEQTLEHGVSFSNFNTGKLGVTIDPSNPTGREVILDLVHWADVVTESFSPKAMAGWGLDYESLKLVNPNLIMLSSCLMGQTGPRAQVPGYGNMAAAITGFYELTGWPDRSPAGPYLAYTDGVSPRFMLASLLSALEHKRRTGEGQYIDISQAEAAIHMLAPAILDYELNARVWQRDGNRDLQLCPHGVFPTHGEDRWIAIACQSDEAWRALAEMAALPKDADLATAVGRKAREAELEEAIGAWTQDQDEQELTANLINAGIAAHVVQNTAECWADPQLGFRDHFVPTQHASLGEVIVEGTRFKLSRTPARITRAHPGLGEHNAQILFEILGYDVDRAADVFASLAME
ncbi:MAG: CoA transferase [Pseudomonadales bacterium]|jgi:crotonobetainyl-CoA:carnitine CoA-transferase CaiB-like acyl-CoA transferase|nr:CoA transferase [Pseudomonadales bacterium]MDP6472472.1 CoA transferase [Pseudomonadales bacterium]MDP6828717.1 CoA transferase [Pseudomonadales bacterium]MDP6971486.1 CoA transferase [Pseudomonadales bacterium]|tara:strand:+ start:2905 stop:5295 length:2391 start_codon:yes stop_codon:yes gene_type:complete